MQLTTRIKTIVAKSAVVAGAADITDATAIDMAGFEGVRFIFVFGALTAGTVLSVAAAGKATSSPTPGTDDLVNTKVTVVDTSSDKAVVLDINQPIHRYVRPFVKRATQNAVLSCIIAELYGSRKTVAADASVVIQEMHVSPALGTA